MGHTHYYYKHQGDVRGHTYWYPQHDSWRTQDPAVAGLYGQVWQISTGNAGWKPGGGDAGPNDTLDQGLWWNGVEFIDVNVTENIATINVYRDYHTESYDIPSDLGTDFNLADTIIPQMATVPVIYGYVLDSNGTPVADVNLSAGNGWSDLTDANGYYEIPVHYGWSGTITPAKQDYTFEPNSISYSNVTADIADRNYSATYAPDFTPPEPDPMEWAVGGEPSATGPTSITMTAATATDTGNPPVMYYFECTNYGDASSGWQLSPTYVANNLSPGTQYTFRVKARDSAAAQNETDWSTEQSATTLPPSVGIIGSWVTGTTHAKESGTNRALVFIAHAEHTGSVTLNSVTYGGRSTTKVVERIISSGTTRTYVAAFILNDAGITAATTTTFTPTWSTTPYYGTAYASVFLQNVNQSTLTGATASNATSSGATITTSALANSDGDMVIDAATCSNTGTYTTNNSFTKDVDFSVSNFDGVDGHKSTTGANETPSVTHSTSTGRQSLIGFVVKVVPVQATNPSPPNLATDVSIDADLSWTAGIGATSHDVYFGTVSPPPFQVNQTGTTFDPGTLNIGTTYYWRIDEHNSGGITQGTVWSFTTVPPPPGQASNPTPADGATSVGVTTDLSWTAGSVATSHDVYFGTTNPPPQVSSGQAGTTYDTGTMSGNTTYYWRIDEKNAGVTTTGIVWSFTTAVSAPTFVAAGAVASGTGTITPALPAGIATGDILLLFLETSNQEISISNQNGGTWAEVTNSPQGTGTAAGSTGARLTVFWSRYNGTQGAPTTSDSGDHQLGRIIAVRGAVASGNPWDVTAGAVEAASDTSGSIPGATTTVTNTLVVVAIATSLPDSSTTTNFSSWTNSNLTGIAERTDNTVTAGNGGGLGIATGTKATAGAYSSTAVTLASSAYKGMMSIAIKP